VCGIAGLFDPERKTDPEGLARQVGAMAEVLTHRGPDAEGYWSDPECGLAFGHRRLAVVGLGPDGSQPMVSPDRRWVLNYNGELYNHADLRRRLAGEGMVFRGGSDTEVLVAAVQAWGLDRPSKPAKDVRLGAVDRQRRELHLVRDRFGEKPLYYGWVGNRLAFASELKSLALLPGFNAPSTGTRWLCTCGTTASRHRTPSIGSSQVVARAGGDGRRRRTARCPPRVRSYWSARQAVEDARRRPLGAPPEVLADQLESALSDSVAARMVADVPVGAFLSGGVDSSVVVALMQRHSHRPVRTYTVGFADRAFDESAEAAAVAAHLGTDHTPSW